MSKLGKSFNYLLAVLFILSIFLLKIPVARAVTCDISTIEPKQVLQEEKTTITLETLADCFPADKYKVVAYPAILDITKVGKSYVTPRKDYNDLQPVKPKTKKKLSFDLYFAKGLGYNDKFWKIVVCSNLISYSDILDGKCKDDLVAQTITDNDPNKTTDLYLGKSIPGKPPNDLPIVDLEAQKEIGCWFQIGNEEEKPITIKKIKNIIRKRDGNYDYENYGWWLYGEQKQGDQTRLNRRDNDPEKNEFIISETPLGERSAQARILDKEGLKKVKPGIHRICVDIESESTERAANVQFQNCLFIDMTAGKADQPMSCDDAQKGFLNCSKYPGRCTSSGDETKVLCDNKTGVQTAIGCIHTNPVSLVKDFLKFALGISGGLAFLLMIFGAFQMLTSAGNPETLNAGKERLTSALIGLLLIIFSVLLLQIIGVDILGLGQQFGLK